MPRERNKWIETPNWLWTVYLKTGKELRLTAVGLLEEVMERSSPKRWERSKQRVHGYLSPSWMLRALAAEYLLKSLSIRDSGRIRKTHYLLQLLKALDPDTQARDRRAGNGARESISPNSSRHFAIPSSNGGIRLKK